MKEEAKKTGSKLGSGILSGRALFKFDPNLFQDDEAAADQDLYADRSDNDEEETKMEDGALQDIDEDEQEDGDDKDEENGDELEVAKVDAALFCQENVGDEEEEEPDFD